MLDQWKRIGVTGTHEQLETKLYVDNTTSGNFDVAIEFVNDFMDDPTAQFTKFLTKAASPIGYSGHEDVKLDQMYETQRRMRDPAARKAFVHDMERYALTQAYNVPLLWFHRIIANNAAVKGWAFTPSHYVGQDLVEVWLDRK